MDAKVRYTHICPFCLGSFCIWMFVATIFFLFVNQILIYADEKWPLGDGDSNWSWKTECNCSRWASQSGREPKEPSVCQKQTAKQKKEGEREGSSRAKAAAAEPDKPCGLYLLLKFCSVRKCIVTALKSTAIYKLTLLRKPVLWQPNRHHCQGNYLV